MSRRTVFGVLEATNDTGVITLVSVEPDGGALVCLSHGVTHMTDEGFTDVETIVHMIRDRKERVRLHGKHYEVLR